MKARAVRAVPAAADALALCGCRAESGPSRADAAGLPSLNVLLPVRWSAPARRGSRRAETGPALWRLDEAGAAIMGCRRFLHSCLQSQCIDAK